jgi:hypothetical protein
LRLSVLQSACFCLQLTTGGRISNFWALIIKLAPGGEDLFAAALSLPLGLSYNLSAKQN